MSQQERYTDEGLDTYASFIDVDDTAEASEKLPELDRSELEAFSLCPASAVISQSKLYVEATDAMNSGQAVHDVISQAIAEWIETQGWIGGDQGHNQTRYLADWIRGQATMARPDVQPDVMDALKGSAYAIAEFIAELHPNNIMRFDGGTGRRSGQIGWNVPSIGRCITSELDLLVATPSKEVLDEHDWKSGQRRTWTAAEVRNSFQFGLHAWLVLRNYPDVNTLNVTIWPTRNVKSRCSVQFFRNDLQALENRILTAAQYWAAYNGKPLETVPAWPSAEKCRLCSGAAFCPLEPPQDVADDPAAYVGALVALGAKIDAMKEAAIAHVELTGRDIITDDGLAFGFNKPIERKARAALYYSADDQAEAPARAPRERKTRTTKAKTSREAPSSPDDDALFDQAIANLSKQDQ